MYVHVHVESFTEYASQAVGLHDFDVAGLVDAVTKEEVPRKHWFADETAGAIAPRPDREQRQKCVEPLGDQLIMDELFGMAMRPQRPPLLFNCQGFAPFGSRPVLEVEPSLPETPTISNRRRWPCRRPSRSYPLLK